MAYLKITPIKTNTHLKQSLEYIQNPKKTDDKFLVEGYMCFYDYAYESFNDTLNHSLRKSGNNIAHHIIQSFSPDDNVEPQQINEIGKKLVERMYPNHQYVIATHIDGEHIHNHIILCATNRVTHKKLISNKNTLQKMRDISDELCKEYGLSVIQPLPKTKREILKADIDNSILLAANMEQFIEIMQKKGYEVKQNKYIAFKGSYMGTFIRSKSLGTAYTEFKIAKRIENKAEVKNQKINLFYNKSFGSSKRKEIRRDIDNVLSHTNSFDEFIAELSKKYDIKQGKHIAFREKEYGKRFIRAESIGREYSESMLRLKFDDPEHYSHIKENCIALRKFKAVKPLEEFASRNASIKAVNNSIRILNRLNELNIKTYNDLLEKIIEERVTLVNSEKARQQTEERYNAYRKFNSDLEYLNDNTEFYKKYLNMWDDEKEKFRYRNKYLIDLFENKCTRVENFRKTYNYTPKTMEELENEIKSQKAELQKREIEITEKEIFLQELENLKTDLDTLTDRNDTPEEVIEKEERKIVRQPQTRNDYYTR